MKTRIPYFGLVSGAVLVLLAGRVSHTDDLCLCLTYLDRSKINEESDGLIEPSGLALSHGTKALWAVCDDTRRIFKLKLDGKLNKDKCFDIPDGGLEGIALDPTGEFLLTVDEDDGAIVKIEIDKQEVTKRRRVIEMSGYRTISQDWFRGGPNRGLEGITWNEKTGTIFVLKEGPPGLLVEVSADLQKILSHRLLNEANGFLDNDVTGDVLEYSGICYDPSRDRFWIVSGEGKRLFLFDAKLNQVIQSFALGYAHKGEYLEIEDAEGVAMDPDSKRLYVVSDKEARLYVFDIRH